MKRVGMGNHTVVLSLVDKLGIVGGSPLLRVCDGAIGPDLDIILQCRLFLNHRYSLLDPGDLLLPLHSLIRFCGCARCFVFPRVEMAHFL